ncbi:hypothetical protein [Acetobacter malorum]|uniref:hypothetical protein n=1 Tax=Acetobacter malorum TaxID=178901 RepID=UPI0039E8B734
MAGGWWLVAGGWWLVAGGKVRRHPPKQRDNKTHNNRYSGRGVILLLFCNKKASLYCDSLFVMDLKQI